LFKANTDGSRVLGLGLAVRDPHRSQIDMALEGIGAGRSPFEQYHALVLAARLLSVLDPTAKEKLRDVIQTEIDKRNISPSDQSRWITANDILTTLQKELTLTKWTTSTETMGFPAGAATIACIEVRPSSEFLHYE